MAKFKVGDRVRTKVTDTVSPRHQNKECVVEDIQGERIIVKFPDGSRRPLFSYELHPTTDTKSLRAKYKAAPSKRDMVLIGEWNAPESGPGTFYAPRSRRSQVERTFLAIEEGDESKEAFYSVINAGGVFIRD